MRMIGNYAFALKSHLRNQFHAEEIESSVLYTKETLEPKHHVPNQIAQQLFSSRAT